MFIEERILKRLIKQAHKVAGLVLVNTGEDYIEHLEKKELCEAS